jgi:CheY-like chemotaxis protein
LPVIALTARNEVEDRHQAREAGVNDRLVKPVDPRDLKTVLDKYLADRNARGE